MQTNIYIDGFNLYYGGLKGTSYKWLDVALLCAILLPKNQINRIRYFTAEVKPFPNNPQQLQRQQTYLRALATIPNLTIHYGHYLSSTVRMPLAHPPASGPRTVEVIKMEEKGSDVNIATYLLVDGFANDYEVAIVMSNDSDLFTPIAHVIHNLHLKVGVLYPHKNPSQALKKVATFMKPIRPGALAASQFPTQLLDRNGKQITKPASW